MKHVQRDKHYLAMEENIYGLTNELVPVEEALNPLKMETEHVWKLFYPEFDIWRYINNLDFAHFEGQVKKLQDMGNQLINKNRDSKHEKRWAPIIEKLRLRISKCKRLLNLTKKRCKEGSDRYEALYSRLRYYSILKSEKLSQAI